MIPCKLHPDRVEAVLGNEVRVLSVGDFVRALADQVSNSVGQDQNTSGHFVQYPLNLLYSYEDVASKFFVMYYPEAVRRIKGWGDDEFTIPFPNVIITAKIQARREGVWEVVFESLRYYMTNIPPERVPLCSDPAELLRTPNIAPLALPNIGNDGGMCFGHNSIPPDQSTNEYRGINWLFNILTDTPFNSDLSIPGKPDVRPRGWVEHLATRHDRGHGFPYEEFFGESTSDVLSPVDGDFNPDTDHDDEDDGDEEDGRID